MGNYDDIINLKRPISKKHQPMSIYNRAGQFSPFAALTNYSDIIAEEGRLTKSQIDLNEDQIVEIDRVLQYAKNNLNTKVNIIYFVKDNKKEGGDYLNIEDNISKINEDSRLIYFKNGNIIPIDDIVYASLIKE